MLLLGFNIYHFMYNVSWYFDFSSLLRNLGYNGDKPIASLYETHRASGDVRNLDLSAPSQSELMKLDIPEATFGHKYIKSSLKDSQFERIEQASSGLSFARTDMKTGNISFQAETVCC